MYRRLLMLTTLVVVLSLSGVALAQEGGPPMGLPPLPEGVEVIAEGLNYPRQLTVGPDGVIYVAEVGPGGDIIVSTPEGDVPFGPTSQVTAIAADGTTSVVLGGLPSAGGIGGAADVALADDGIWIIVNGPGPEAQPAFLMASALKLDADSYHLLQYVDFYTHELEVDPDGNGLDTNPTDVEIADDGTVFLLDTGANAVYTLADDGSLVEFVVWPENPVPTGLSFGPDGNLYVSFLGTEIAPGAGMVQQISPDGEILETYAGYNALTDLVVADDGTIYAVSLISGFGEQGPLPGQILRVDGDGGEVVVDGLFTPYGIDLDADGNLIFSVATAFGPPGTGMVVRYAVAGM